MSISAFAVNRIGRAENETTQSVQMTDNQKGEAAATRQKSSEAQTKTRQENMKKSDSESKTKDNSEEQKKDSKDADNKGAKENSTEKDAKEDSEKNISKEEKSTKEEKNTEKKSEETTDVSEATTTAAKETTTEAAEKKTEAVTEKTPEGKDSKEATSEEKAEEETQAEDDKNKEIAVTSISGPTEVQVGKTIRLTGTSGSYGYSHSWSSSNKNIATVTGNGSTAEVKGVAVGTVTITHRYSSQWNGNTRTETYQVKVTKFADNYSGEAAIYYLANPAGDPWTNDTGAWAPSQDTSNTLANISTSGATWEDGHVDDIVYENKNIKKYFDFTVTLTGKEGEEYSLPATITGGSDKSGKKENVAISGTTTFKLKHGDTITIENLPAGVSYKVEEATPSDYTMNATGQEGTMDAEAKTAAFTNTKTGDIDTGVYLDNLPYILVFAGVLAIAAVFIVRRRRFED